jgi:hypothetical protein
MTTQKKVGGEGVNLLVKVSVNRFASSRIENIRDDVKTETQRLREKTINRLEEIFKVAAKIGRGEIRHQRIKGKMTPISLNQRRRWVKVAEEVALTMKSIASNFDEKETYNQLNKLERLVNEATATDQPSTGRMRLIMRPFFRVTSAPTGIRGLRVR